MLASLSKQLVCWEYREHELKKSPSIHVALINKKKGGKWGEEGKRIEREMKAKQIRGRERKKRVAHNGFLFLFFIIIEGKTERRKCPKLFFFLLVYRRHLRHLVMLQIILKKALLFAPFHYEIIKNASFVSKAIICTFFNGQEATAV